MKMRKTKVICTIGPACEDAKVLSEMCYAGMNVARLNFSHGSHEEHQKKIDLIKGQYVSPPLINHKAKQK